MLRKKGPRKLISSIPEWEEHDGLIYYKGKLYIPNNVDLRNEIIKTCHDTLTTGHPGKHGTLELVSRFYWWPRMAAAVEKYVLGCDRCQRYKPANHPKAVLQPQPEPDGPWEYVGIDLITQLPDNRGITAIAVIVDHYSGQAHLVPTNDNLNVDGTQDIYYKDIFRLHGIPKRIFSDRGPQFAARVMKALYKRLGIEPGLTTAYHPQGNGKVERKNQDIEIFLRLFCAQRQDDWVDYLPAAEFALNSRVSSATGKAPFELIYGYLPDFTIPIGRKSNIPSLDERLDRMAQARKDASAALRMTKAKMKEQYEKGKRTAHEFKVGEFVWLNAKNIHIHQQTPKLGPRQLGPFKITGKHGPLDYHLELPHWLKIHPVFHVDRLSPWHDQGIPQPLPPQPEIIEGEENYEIEEILDSRLHGRGKKLQFLIKWKGFSDAHTAWEPESNLEGTADEAIAEFYQKHPSAPRRINASDFEHLNASFRPPTTETDPLILAEQYPNTYDLGWEDGKYYDHISREDARG